MRVTPQCDSINSLAICQIDSVAANPAVDFDGTNYLVAWDDARFGNPRIRVTRVTPGGSILAPANFIGDAGADELYPDVLFNGTRYFIVWCHYSSPYGVSGRFVNTNAQAEDTVLTIALTQTYKYINPKVAYSGSRYLVVWPDLVPSSSNFDLYGQLLSDQGELIGARITIADDPSPEKEASIVFDGTKFLVAWNDSGVIYGRYIDTLGQCMGTSFVVSATTPRDRATPWIAISDTNFLIVWQEAYADRDIYGNVDLTIGIAADDDQKVIHTRYSTTILTGPFTPPSDVPWHLYDISGRSIEPSQMQMGVYFLRIRDCIVHKLIKVR